MQSNSDAVLQIVNCEIPGIEMSKGPKLFAAKDWVGIEKLAISESKEIINPNLRFIL